MAKKSGKFRKALKLLSAAGGVAVVVAAGKHYKNLSDEFNALDNELAKRREQPVIPPFLLKRVRDEGATLTVHRDLSGFAFTIIPDVEGVSPVRMENE